MHLDAIHPVCPQLAGRLIERYSPTTSRSFTNAWNEFLFAFVFITTESLRALPVGLQSMVVGDIQPWGQLMAASLLTAIPVAALYIFAHRFLVEGLTIGAVKG